MAAFEVGARVFARTGIGRFVSECEAAATRTAQEGAEEMASYARAFASYKTGEMAGTIQPVMLSAREGAAVVGTDHWRHQEYGTLPHLIGPGMMGFFWEKEGRWFKGASGTIISHPGNPSVHFMKRAYDITKQRMMLIARRNFPG